MTFTLYRIPQLRANKQNSILFNNATAKFFFFNQVTQKLAVSTNDSTVGRITDLGKLYQQVTVFTNGDNPYSLYNYASITFGGRQYFYFVTDFKEIGQNQVIYYLKKDTLITYLDQNGTSGVDLSQHKALITREHKQRFNYAAEKALYHRIPEPGDTTTPYIHKTMVPYSLITRAKLVYKNRTDSKPVAYPYVETATNVPVSGSDWIGTVTSWKPGTNEIQYVWDGDFEYTFGTGTPNISVSVPSSDYVFYERNEVGLRFLRKKHKTTGIVTSLLSVPAGVDLRIKIDTTDVQKLCAANGLDLTAGAPSWSYITSTFNPLNYAPTSTKALPLWSKIDQYDAATDRIVEIPYFPIDDLDFYEDGYGIFIPLETKILDRKTITINNPFNYNMTKDDINHVVGNDPKLYTSQFAPIIATMNGMSQGIKRELIGDPTVGIPQNIKFYWDFHLETLFPSVFNTKVSFYITDFIGYDEEEPYELLRSWTVNNEIASVKDELYTYNQYYKDLDDKQRQVQESASFRNTALNAVNQSLGVVGGMIAGGTPNPLQLTARSGQAAINIAQSFMDLQDKLKMNKIQAKQKYINMLLSSTQISGSPLNFIKKYRGDRVSFITFRLKNVDLAYWDEVFHKFGYTTLEYKIPTLKTRKFWDYKEMIIDEVASAYVTDECLDDIKARFAEGVTLYHYNSGVGPSSIDWTQTKENWEI